MKLSTIKANPKNPRVLRDDKFKKLVKSIQDFPQMMELRPIVTDENGIVLGGNMRLRALQQIFGRDGEVPDTWVVKAADLTEEQKREFVIKDNSSFGEWDWDALANEWDSAELTEWGLDVPEFEPQEVGGLEPNTAEDDQFDEETECIEVRCQRGDVWQLGNHRLMCGDSIELSEVQRLMGGA